MDSLTSPPRSVSPTLENCVPRSPSILASPSSKTPILSHGIYAMFSYREHLDDTKFLCMIGCYDPSINTWTHECLVPGLNENHVLKGFFMVSVETSIYVIGGRVCRKEKVQEGKGFVKVAEVNVEVRSSVLRYDVISKEWSTCAPLNMPRYDFACSVCDNKIYVAGGQSTLDSARGLSSCEMYDPLLNKWTPLPCMSALRYKCVGVTWQGKFHVIGGFTCNNSVMDCIMDRCSAEVYDAEQRKWNSVRGMWRLDIPPNQIVVIDEKLFSSGDCLNAWKGHIEAYNGELNLWDMLEGSQKKNLVSNTCSYYGNRSGNSSESLQRICLTMAPVENYLYFMAGYRMAGDESSCCTMSMVHRFDTTATSNKWKTFEPMQVEGERELCSHCCVVQLS